MNQNVSSARKFAILVGAFVVLSSAVGCFPKTQALQPRSSGPITLADRSTCVGQHIQSIWKGEDIAGPECMGFIAYDRSTTDDERRIRKVCEHTQIRTRLTGEAPTSFTLRTCAARAMLEGVRVAR